MSALQEEMPAEMRLFPARQRPGAPGRKLPWNDYPVFRKSLI